LKKQAFAATVYSESPSAGPGGSERCVWEAARVLAERGSVRVAHHKPPGAMEETARYFGVEVSDSVAVRYFHPEEDPSAEGGSLLSRWRRAGAWRTNFTSDTDVFVGFLHAKPPFCRARRGVLVVLFPTFDPRAVWNGEAGPARRLYARFEWRARLATYQRRFSISSFSHRWTRERWGIDTRLLFPPVDGNFNDRTRLPRILSVGRFASSGHLKSQREMLGAFAELQKVLPDYTYSCVGGVSDVAGDQAYFSDCLTLSRAIPNAEVTANVHREHLCALLETSSIFWHAAGHDREEQDCPQDMEHFGITTVEAMAAGCVPVVINKAGQREIVQDGVSGFLWNTWEELKDRTRLLARDGSLRNRLAEGAKRRAAEFGVDRFRERLFAAIG
jgi:glycosyltransferase involved in cell wall biosynthesis